MNCENIYTADILSVKIRKILKIKSGKLVNFYSVTAYIYATSYSSKKITNRIKLTTVNNPLDIVLQINKNLLFWEERIFTLLH